MVHLRWLGAVPGVVISCPNCETHPAFRGVYPDSAAPNLPPLSRHRSSPQATAIKPRARPPKEMSSHETSSEDSDTSEDVVASQGAPDAGPDLATGDTTDEAAPMDDLVCRLCGSVLCVSGGLKEEEPEEKEAKVAKPPTTTTKKPKVKTTPKMLSQPTVRTATRIAMLTAVPGVTKRRAAAILAVYATFGQLRSATPEMLEQIPVGKKGTLGRDLAEAVSWAMQ